MTTPVVPQLLLEGQAAAPEGPIDLSAMFVMHRAFPRDLDAFATVVPTVPVPDRARWALLAGRFDVFATALHKHHSGEDRGMWPLLAQRGADPAVLDALEADHAGIDPLLSEVRQLLTELSAGGSAATRERLAAATVRLRADLEAHLVREERDGMPLVQRYLTPEDWDRLDREVFQKDYRRREIPAVLGWVAAGLTEEEMHRLPGANPVFLVLARFLARRRVRSDARVFGR